MMKAIISPYENITQLGEIVSMPTVVVDTEASRFDSSDMPASVVDAAEGERLIFLDAEAHAQAVNLGYVEVDI